MIRLFIGVKIPTHIQRQLSTIYGGLPSAKWIEPDMLHLTVKFIGEIDEIVYEDIAELLDDIKTEPFEIKFKGVDFFSVKKTAHTIWVKPSGNLEPLKRLKQKIDVKLRDELGLPIEDRKFTPHVTIARLKKANMSKVGNYMEWYNLFETSSFTVNEFYTFHSNLLKSGAVYTSMDQYALK